MQTQATTCVAMGQWLSDVARHQPPASTEVNLDASLTLSLAVNWTNFDHLLSLTVCQSPRAASPGLSHTSRLNHRSHRSSQASVIMPAAASDLAHWLADGLLAIANWQTEDAVRRQQHTAQKE